MSVLLSCLILLSTAQGSWGIQVGGLLHARRALSELAEEPLENDFHAKPPHDKKGPDNLPLDLHGPMGENSTSGPEPLPLPPLPPRMDPRDPNLRVGGDNATDGTRPQTGLSVSTGNDGDFGRPRDPRPNNGGNSSSGGEGPMQDPPGLPVIPMFPFQPNGTGPPVNLVFPGRGESDVIIPLTPQQIPPNPINPTSSPSPGSSPASSPSISPSPPPNPAEGASSQGQSPPPDSGTSGGPSLASDGESHSPPPWPTPNPTLSPLPEWVRDRSSGQSRGSGSGEGSQNAHNASSEAAVQGINLPPWGQTPGAASPAAAPGDGGGGIGTSPSANNNSSAPQPSGEGLQAGASTKVNTPVIGVDGSLDLPTAASGPSSSNAPASGPSSSGSAEMTPGASPGANGPSPYASGPSAGVNTANSGEGTKADPPYHSEGSADAPSSASGPSTAPYSLGTPGAGSGPAAAASPGEARTDEGVWSGGGRDGSASPSAAPQASMVRDVNPQTQASVVDVSDATQHPPVTHTSAESANAPADSGPSHTAAEGANGPTNAIAAPSAASGPSSSNASASGPSSGGSNETTHGASPGAPSPAGPPWAAVPPAALLGTAGAADPAAVAALQRAGILRPAQPPPTADGPLRGPLPLAAIVGAFLPQNPPGTAPAAALDPAMLGAALPNALGPALLPLGGPQGTAPAPSLGPAAAGASHTAGSGLSPAAGEEEAAACVLGRKGGGQAFVECGDGHLGKGAKAAAAPGASNKDHNQAAPSHAGAPGYVDVPVTRPQDRPCRLIQGRDAPTGQAMVECDEEPGSLIHVESAAVGEALPGANAASHIMNERALNGNQGWFPGAPAPAPGGPSFPVMFVSARDIEPEQMPGSVKGAIAASAIAAGGAVAVGLYLAAGEQRRRKKARTAQILPSGAVPLMGVRSYSSETDSLGDTPGTQLPPPTLQDQPLPTQLPGPTPRDLGPVMMLDSEGATMNPLFTTCPDEILPADDDSFQNPIGSSALQLPLDTLPHILVPSAAVPSPALSEDALESVDPYRAFLDGGSDISGEGDAPHPDQDMMMHDINPADRTSAGNISSDTHSNSTVLRDSGAYSQVDGTISPEDPSQAMTPAGQNLAGSVETEGLSSAARDLGASEAGVPAMVGGGGSTGAIGLVSDDVASRGASSAGKGADVAAPTASATPRGSALPSRKRRQMGDLAASLSELRRGSQAVAPLSGSWGSMSSSGLPGRARRFPEQSRNRAADRAAAAAIRRPPHLPLLPASPMKSPEKQWVDSLRTDELSGSQ